MPIANAKDNNNVPSIEQQQAMIALIHKMHQRYLDFDDPAQFKDLQITSSDRFTDGEELIFSISVDDILLAELFGIKHDNGARFLLDDVLKALDFPIDFTDGVYSGWFIVEENTFHLYPPSDANDFKLLIDGERLPVDSDKYVLMDDGLYINADEITRWFGISARFDFTDLNVRLYPSIPLPIQQKIARQNKSIQDTTKNVTAVLPRRSNDYQPLSPQTVDATIGVRQTQNNESVNYSIIGARDFAFLRSEFFLAGNQDDIINDGRLKFSKSSSAANLLGIGATNFAFGDITPIRTNGQTSNLSPGISVTNSPINQLDNINLTNFTGPVQTGWDVEIYRNDVLIDAQYNIENGLYDFRDVPLVFGLNTFEIVFYGPQGQKEKKVIERTIDRTLQNQGGVYAFSLNKLGNSILGIRKSIGKQSNQGYLFSGSYRQNIADNVSILATSANRFAGEDNLNTLSLGLNARLFDKYLFGIEGVMNDQQQQELNTNIRTQFGKHTLSASGSILRGVNSTNESVNATNLKLSLSGAVKILPKYSISYINEFEVKNDINGLSSQEFRNSLGTTIFGSRINTGLTFSEADVRISDANSSAIQSVIANSFNLGIQRNFGRTFARLQSSFLLNEGLDPELVSVQLSRSFADKISARLTLSHSMIKKEESFDFNMRWREEEFMLDSSLGYSEQAGLNVSLNLRFGLGYNPLNSEYFFRRNGLANSGTLVVNVFHDANMNGQFDDGETPIPKVLVRAVQARKKGSTDSQGMAIINNLSNNIPTDIMLDLDSLPDPFLMPLTKGFSVTPRGGFIDTADIPVVYASEVEGSLFVVNEFGHENTLANVDVILYNESGEQYAKTTSEYDGYYLFTDVLPGNYTASVDPDYISKNKLKPLLKVDISLNQTGELSSGNDFTMYYQAINLRYVVSLGVFNSKEVLNAFWSVMRKTFPTILGALRPYLFKAENGKGDLLGIYFSQDQSKAANQCDLLFQHGIECEVVMHKTYID